MMKKAVELFTDLQIANIQYFRFAKMPVKRMMFWIHFENVNLQNAKNTVGKTTCITGNFPIYLLEYGTKEHVIQEAKRQIDIGAPGGGFIFETNASIENVKRENLMALYDTVRTYGKK